MSDGLAVIKIVLKCLHNILHCTFQPNNIQSSLTPEATSILGLFTPLFTPKEIIFDLKKKPNPRKAPNHYLITGRLLQELPGKI